MWLARTVGIAWRRFAWPCNPRQKMPAPSGWAVRLLDPGRQLDLADFPTPPAYSTVDRTCKIKEMGASAA